MRGDISPCVAMALISSVFVVRVVSGDRNKHGVSDQHIIFGHKDQRTYLLFFL